MENSKMGVIEAVFFVLAVITNKIILNFPKEIVLWSGNSAWLNVIYISIIVGVLAIIVCNLFSKFGGYDILDISHYLGGNFLKIALGTILIVIPLFNSIDLVRDFSEDLKLIYFNTSPLIFISLFFVIAAIIANKAGFTAIFKTCTIIMPIVMISIVVILFSHLKNFEIERLLPIFGNGVNETFISGLSNISVHSGFLFLFFLMPFLKNTEKYKKIGIIAWILSSLYLLLSVLSLLLVFASSTVTKEPLSLYLIVRTIEYGTFFQRVDALFILLWILSTMTYLSVLMFMALYIFKKIFNTEDRKVLASCFGMLILALSLIPENTVILTTIQETFFKYYFLITIFILCPIILYLASRKKKKELQNNKPITKNIPII
ncbi:MAG: spore germination protein [Lachnospiraceae bacterium]|jgi:spore germination protein (amino acid permease)|nr:spore germination protein [Lachnospiraceae bacterium]